MSKIKQIVRKTRMYWVSKFQRCTCWEITNRFFILSDGSVTTCCLDGFGVNAYGNINNMSLEECFNSKKLKKLTNNLLSSSLCQTCPFKKQNVSKNEFGKYLEDLQHGFEGVQAEIAGRCNYACDGCYSNIIPQKRAAMPDLVVFLEKLKPVLPKLKYINCFNFGEPFLNPQFSDFLIKCRQVAPEIQIGISTNLMLLTKEKAQACIDSRVTWLIVSLHGAPDTENMLKYSRRGCNYEKVLDNIKMLKNMRDMQGAKFPQISARVILFDWNDTEEMMDKFRNDMEKLGLRANGGNILQDSYHYILDANSPSPRSSKRFLAGNDEFKQLVAKGEIAFDEKEIH